MSFFNHAYNLYSVYRSSIPRRNDNLLVFGSWWGNRFADNPKYLYLYALKQGMNAIWITKNKLVYEDLISRGLPVAMADSIEGIRYCKNAKYVFYCTSLADVNQHYVGGAILINLWHGIPLKKIMFDDEYSNEEQKLIKRFFRLLLKYPYRNTYYVSTSDTISKIYISAFDTTEKHILQLGQPRNDCFFDGTYKKIKYASLNYSRVISYLPTHRNEGKTSIDINKIFDLKDLNSFCIKHDILFIIKKHYYHRHDTIDLSEYSNIIDLTNTDYDTQELMFNSDILITDYSSCYIDYLLLNRPIIFYNYDFDNYLKEDRKMYFHYDDVTPGPKVQDYKSLRKSIEDILNNNNQYDELLDKVKNLFYSIENQRLVSGHLLDTILNN